MRVYFVLYLLCVSCQPQQYYILHGIPAFMGGTSVWADETCKKYGDILSGAWDARNRRFGRLIKKEKIIFQCVKESAEF